MSLIAFILIFFASVSVSGLFLLWLVFVLDSFIKGHDLPTDQREIRTLFKIISEQKRARNFYDLGCAHGALVLCVKRKFPDLSVHAIDNDRVRVFFAKIRAFFLQQKIQFVCADIFNIDLSNADIVYAYLWYDIMPLLEKKLQKELKTGTLVITNTSSFPTWKPIKEIAPCDGAVQTCNIETLFVYQKE